MFCFYVGIQDFWWRFKVNFLFNKDEFMENTDLWKLPYIYNLEIVTSDPNLYMLSSGYIWNKTEIKLKQNNLFQF